MTTQTKIEQRVMANVGVIYTTRKTFSATALKVYVLVLSALALWKLVWVTRVEQNFLQVMQGGIVAEWNYLTYAVVHTHPTVQITLVIGVAAFALLLSDLFRSTVTPRQRLAW